MIIGRQSVALLLALGIATPSIAQNQKPQISEGVRAMAQVGTGGFGPQSSAYMVLSQPPIERYLNGQNPRFFNAETELVIFFESFPSDVQKRGLWITRGGLIERENQENRNRLVRLVDEARKREILMYVCTIGEAPGSLVAWECQRESPSQVAGRLHCLPREKPHLGHPWWDCQSALKPTT